MRTLITVLILLIIASVVYAGTLYDPQQRDVFGSSRDDNEFTSAQTQTEIVAGVSGKKLIIDQIITSFAAAGSLYFSEGTTVKLGKIRCIANDTKYLYNVNLRFSVGEGIDVTTDYAGNHTVDIEYHQE